ncbi:hypothetical protein NPIL_616071, partial [Nephila pilipes]
MSSHLTLSEALIEELCTIPYPVPSPLFCKVCYNPRVPASTVGLRKIGIFKENSRYTRHLRDAHKIATASRVRYECVRCGRRDPNLKKLAKHLCTRSLPSPSASNSCPDSPPTSKTSPSGECSPGRNEVSGGNPFRLASIFSPPITSTVSLIPSILTPSPLRSGVAVASSPISIPAPRARPAPELSDVLFPPGWEKVEASAKEPPLVHLEEDLSWCGPPVHVQSPPRGLPIDALRDSTVEDLVASIDKYDGSYGLLFAPSGCPSHRWSTGGISNHCPVELPRLSCSLPLHRAVDSADEGVPPASLEGLSPV